MKPWFTFLLLVMLNYSWAQTAWSWFSRNKVPLYNQGAMSFTDFRLINGKPADGFLPGYYITLEGERKEGEIQLNYPYIMERMLAFRADGNMTFFRPKEVKGYFVDGVYRASVTFNASMIKGAEGLHTFFMIPKVQGTLSLYYYTNQEIVWDFEPEDDRIFGVRSYFEAYSKYHATPESEVVSSPSADILKKGDDFGFITDRLMFGFPNKMSDLVSECPELATKVKAKQSGYKSTNLEKIVAEYNACLEAK
jgi:hypothetical protein